MHKIPPLIAAFLVTLAARASAEPVKRLTILATDNLPADVLGALRAEAQISGYAVELVPVRDAGRHLAQSFSERPGTAAVIWLGRGEGEEQVHVTAGDTELSAPLVADSSGPAVAAIASSLLSELRDPIEVEVSVKVRTGSLNRTTTQIIKSAPDADEVQDDRGADFQRNVFLGGLVAPNRVWALEGGLLFNPTEWFRVGAGVTAASVGGDTRAQAYAIQGSLLRNPRALNAPWFSLRNLRFELGARALYTRITEKQPLPILIICENQSACMEEKTFHGFGAGVFGSIAVNTDFAAYFLKVGVDMLSVDGDRPAPYPTASIGLEI
jgi:hypothetical protein